jgi:hypothetical protein
MSAEQQYLEPALRTIAATNGQGQERSVKAVKYVGSSLIRSLSSSTDSIDTRLPNFPR